MPGRREEDYRAIVLVGSGHPCEHLLEPLSLPVASVLVQGHLHVVAGAELKVVRDCLGKLNKQT